MTPYIEIIDRHGRRRRAQKGEALKDGEKIFLSPMFMDSTMRTQMTFMDNVVRDADAEAATRRRGFRRGYGFAQNMAIVSNDAATAADAAFESKRARLETSRRNVSDGTTDAARAYAERSERLENAWRKDYRDDANAAPQSTQDARAAADRAYEDRKSRLSNAWRR
jgi:hypothetical protein